MADLKQFRCIGSVMAMLTVEAENEEQAWEKIHATPDSEWNLAPSGIDPSNFDLEPLEE
jgi:hypothetical protein